MNYAYCTLLSSLDYLNAVLILNKSLRYVKSKYPLMVMVTEDLTKNNKELFNLLRKHGIIPEEVPKLSYSNITKQKYAGQGVLNTASKINILNMHDYDKLVYLDADMFVLKNCDELFNYRDGSMSYTGSENLTTLFVIVPKNHLEFRFMKAAMEKEDCFDGNLLEECWFFLKDNEEEYGIPKKYVYEMGEYVYVPEDTKIVHLSHDVPIWNYPPSALNGFDYPLSYYQKLML